MPELPEVETTRRGIEPHLLDQTISTIIIRQHQLRWPVPRQLKNVLPGKKILDITRRGKYLLIHTTAGTLLIHLGMSGSLRILTAVTTVLKHDHVDLVLKNKTILRYTDPRRFGCWLWTTKNPSLHPLIKDLGPEPLSVGFHDNHLYQLSRNRKAPVKTFIMDSHTVVGVGNIYANESLFQSGINPKRPAGKISLARYQHLTNAIISTLKRAIEQGGTTLKDFVQSDGKPGYFAQSLNVYDQAGKPCSICSRAIKVIRIGQRSTFYCTHCQR